MELSYLLPLSCLPCCQLLDTKYNLVIQSLSGIVFDDLKPFPNWRGVRVGDDPVVSIRHEYRKKLNYNIVKHSVDVNMP